MSDNKCIVCQKILISDEENCCAECELKDDNDTGRVPNNVNCGACEVIVEEDSAGLVCDKCNSWYHNSCCENPLIEELYSLLNEAPNNVKWFCDKCIWETEKWIKSFKCGTVTNTKKRGRPRRLNTAQNSFKHFLESDSEYDATKEPMVKIEIQNEDMTFGFDDGLWTDSDDYEEKKKIKKKKKIRKKTFQCTQCEKAFSYRSSLRKHMKNQHVKKSYKCKQCENSFPKKSALKEHMKSHAGNELEIQNVDMPIGSDDSQSSDSESNEERIKVKEKNQCDKCGKSFLYKSSFKKHIDNNSCAKSIKCKRCGECLANRGDMKRHMKTHNGEVVYQCSHCGKGFARKDHLITHERIHTGETPYQCNHCGKVFRRQDHLKKHERVHTGEKPYPCGYCDKSFARHDNFKTHERTHTGERPYQCDQCEKSFTNRGGLKQHLNSHNGNKPFHRTSIKTRPIFKEEISNKPFRQTSPITSLPIFTKANSTKPFKRTSSLTTLPIFTKAKSTLPVSTTSIVNQSRTSLSSHNQPSPCSTTYNIPMPLAPVQSHPINASYSSSTFRSSNQIPIHQMSNQPESYPSSPGSPLQNSNVSFPRTPPPNLQHSSLSSPNVSSDLYNSSTRHPYSLASSLGQGPQITTDPMNTSYIPWYSIPPTHTPTIPSSYQHDS